MVLVLGRWASSEGDSEEAVAWADDEANIVSFAEGEVDWSRVPQTHRFVPLGFEAGGAFGRATLHVDFLREVEEVAGDQSSADRNRLVYWGFTIGK